MITRSQQEAARAKAAQMMRAAGVVITDEEAARIDAVDFGLSDLEREGAEILTMVQTERISVKLLVLFPNQTEPEHWHPPVAEDPGKEETVRVVQGPVYFYVEGPATLSEGFIVPGKDNVYTCRHELVLNAGEQLTMEPGAKHWFQAGQAGAVLYSFSSIARDVLDGFTDPDIRRETIVVDE